MEYLIKDRKRVCLLCLSVYKTTRTRENDAFCPDCFTESRMRELCRLNRNLRRARRAGTLATLTINQWFYILDYFNWKCAYCQSRAFEVLEHIIPVTSKGGTTIFNCVPACLSC